MYAVCADPAWPGVFWAVGYSSIDNDWEYDMIDISDLQNPTAYYTPIGADLEQGGQ